MRLLKLLINPNPQELRRPDIEGSSVEEVVRAIIQGVKEGGDRALRSYTKEFDRADIDSLKVPLTVKEDIPAELKKAIERAKDNIYKFHSTQKPHDEYVEVEPGITCWRQSVPIERVGLYIPGGSAPLFSTLLMLAIPAQIAGCREIVVVTPPRRDGSIDPAILYSAQLCGVTQIYRVGGAQAIGALAYGTETIPKVDKIFGPGNRYVTEAKQQVSKTECAIDLPAGPSEVMVVIDASSSLPYAAADLLSQAEHDSDSQVVLLVVAKDEAEGKRTISAVEGEIIKQKENLSRQDIVERSLSHSWAVVVTEPTLLLPLINGYAPEHLIINTKDYKEVAKGVKSAGSVFLGEYACESLGDYASGTNHTLPTARWARSHSGVSLDSFYKKITFQEVTKEGLLSIGESVKILAEAESLDGHARAVTIRLDEVEK
jgi:histidinol dehydrogenase